MDTPRIGQIDDVSSLEGEFVFWRAPIASVPGENLTISYQLLPLGLDYLSQSGLVYGYVAYSNVHADGEPVTYQVVVSVWDGTSIESQTFRWSVRDTNRIAPIDNPRNKEGDKVAVPVRIEDATGQSLEVAVAGLPQGVSYDPQLAALVGSISYRNVSAEEGTCQFEVTIYASDGETEDRYSFFWTVEDMDWWSEMPNLSDQEGEFIYIELPEKNASGQPVEYSFSQLPAGLVWDGTNYALTGRIAYRNVNSPGAEVNVAITVQRIPDAEERTFAWKIADRHRILIPEGVQLENWVGDEIDVMIPTLPRDDADWRFEAVNLPAGLSLDQTTGRIRGTVQNPVNLADWPANYRDYSELGFVEYHVVLRVDDTTSRDERNITWRIWLNGTVQDNTAPTWDAEHQVFRYISSPLGGYLKWGVTFNPTDPSEVSKTQLEAVKIATGFHNVDLTRSALSLFRGMMRDAAMKLLEEILPEPAKQGWKKLEQIQEFNEFLKFASRKGLVNYRGVHRRDDGSHVNVLLSYDNETEKWTALYVGKVQVRHGDTDHFQLRPFAFIVRGKAKKNFNSWLPGIFSVPWGKYTVEVTREIHWLLRR